MSNLVFTNGCFDLIHPGHLRVFEVCRHLAGPFGKVVVGLNSDSSIRRLKGPSRPVMPQDQRRKVLQALRDVDEVRIFSEDTPYDLISVIRPDFVVKGFDYAGAPPSYLTGSFNCTVVLVPLEHDGSEVISTSSIVYRTGQAFVNDPSENDE